MTIKNLKLALYGLRGDACRALSQLRIYMLIGALSTSVDIGSYFTITRFAFHDIDALYAKALSFMLGSICSFYMNRRFTFDVKEKVCIGQIARFYTMVFVSLIINGTAFYICKDVLGIYDLAAAAIALCFSFTAGFFLSKLWVFGQGAIRP